MIYGWEWQVRVTRVRIDYSAENPEAGFRFFHDAALTQNQEGRSRYWFPCFDSSDARCS